MLANTQILLECRCSCTPHIKAGAVVSPINHMHEPRISFHIADLSRLSGIHTKCTMVTQSSATLLQETIASNVNRSFNLGCSTIVLPDPWRSAACIEFDIRHDCQHTSASSLRREMSVHFFLLQYLQTCSMLMLYHWSGQWILQFGSRTLLVLLSPLGTASSEIAQPAGASV